MPTVLALGLDPSVVDLAAAGFTPAQVQAFIDAELDRLRSAGYEVVDCLVDLGETAENVLAQALAARQFDCILIGAGLRAPERLLLFEKLVNVVHAAAPGARICFNTSPRDSMEAVRRWV
jgi:nucleotide-binding universal stress UspA family protein